VLRLNANTMFSKNLGRLLNVPIILLQNVRLVLGTSKVLLLSLSRLPRVVRHLVLLAVTQVG
jgi:hypothetical protein